MKGIERFAGELGNECFGTRKKEWVAAAIGAVGGLASSLIGGAASARAQRRAESALRTEKAKEDAWYARRYNEDYVDTAAGQNLVRRAKEFAKENWRKAAGAQAVAGGTAAATQMAKDAGNKMVGDTIANIAATDQQRKANVDNIHMQNQRQFAQQEMSNEQQRAQNISNASAAASNAMMSAGAAVDQASAKINLKGGSNNGVTTSTTPTTADFQAQGFNSQADYEKWLKANASNLQG